MDVNIAGVMEMRNSRSPRAPADMAALDEDDLMAFIAQRDETAFEVLVSRHFNYAFQIAARMLKKPADAEDVVQDVFLKLWSRPAIWQPEKARFSTWLYRVISNASIDRLRRKTTEPLDAAVDVADESPNPEAAALMGQLKDRVESALDTLPPRQKLALVLTHYQGCTNRESARIMGLSVDALESLLSRGRRQLRSELSDDVAAYLELEREG